MSGVQVLLRLQHGGRRTASHPIVTDTLDWRNSHVLGGGGLHEAIYKPPSFLNRLSYGTANKEKKTKGKAQGKT